MNETFMTVGFDDDPDPFKYTFGWLCFYIDTIIILFVAPACFCLLMLFDPESDHCWANNREDIARGTPSIDPKVRELDAAPYLRYWAYSGFSCNIMLAFCYVYALTIPCRRFELTWHG